MTDREILELLLSKMNHMEAKMDNRIQNGCYRDSCQRIKITY